MPFLVRYPPMHENAALKQGDIVDPFATVMDLMPTFLDLSGTPRPGKVFRGRKVHPIRGKSWVDWIKGAEKEIHNDDVPVGWELHGRAALRLGDFKILYHRALSGVQSLERKLTTLAPPYGKGDWELYNLRADPGETVDLSEQMPEKLAQLKEAWERYAENTQVIWGDPIPTNALVSADETEDPKGWMYYALEKSKTKR